MQSFIRAARHSSSVEPFDIRSAIEAALERDGQAEFVDQPEGCPPVLAFLLRRSGIAVHVVDIDETHIATYADPVAAMKHGFLYTDRASCVPPPPRARRRPPSARGRVTR